MPENARGSDWQVQQAQPASLMEVLRDADVETSRGASSRYVMMPTGFDPLDRLIGGGIGRGELMLIGGAPGVGKTTLTLQMARNVAASSATRGAMYVCYEHDHVDLTKRLLCLESALANVPQPLTLYHVNEVFLEAAKSGQPVTAALRSDKRVSAMLPHIERYGHRLELVKANNVTTTLSVLREMARSLSNRFQGSAALFVDYLQKIPIHPLQAKDEDDKTTIIAEGLKDIANTFNIPVVALAAAERRALQGERIRLFDLRGSSALQYESDVILMLNNKYDIVSRTHLTYNPHKAEAYRNWMILSVEKNRGGPAGLNLEYLQHLANCYVETDGQLVKERLVGDRVEPTS